MKVQPIDCLSGASLTRLHSIAEQSIDVLFLMFFGKRKPQQTSSSRSQFLRFAKSANGVGHVGLSIEMQLLNPIRVQHSEQQPISGDSLHLQMEEMKQLNPSSTKKRKRKRHSSFAVSKEQPSEGGGAIY